jgi:Fe-coproporphyrin III synthase
MKDLITHITNRFGRASAREQFLRWVVACPTFFVKSSLYGIRYWETLHRGRGQSGPEALFLFVTNRCNQRCLHCFFSSELNKPAEGLAIESIRTLCGSIRGKVPTVFLCGGEPTTRPDLNEIVALFIETARVDRLFITSNGLLQDALRSAVDAALACSRHFQLRIPISLDGPPAIHDRIRQSPGGYERASATLRELVMRSRSDSRLVPLVTTVIQKANAECFVEFYKSLRSTFDCQVQLTFVRQDSRDVGGLDKGMLLDAGRPEDLLPAVNDCRKILRKIHEYETSRSPISYLSLLEASFAEDQLETALRQAPVVGPCAAPHRFATIYPDGGVSLCEVVRPFANLREFDNNLLACWNSPAAGAQRKKLSSCWCTYPCALASTIMRNPSALGRNLKRVKHDGYPAPS